MDPERWHRITAVFHEAIALDPPRRAAFLNDACRGDVELRGEVDAMLAGDARAQHEGDPFGPPSVAVSPGMDLGPYRVDSRIGAGGMGDVYRARDTRLNRTVAIKVLPPAFAQDPELRQRFEREAQA